MMPRVTMYTCAWGLVFLLEASGGDGATASTTGSLRGSIDNSAAASTGSRSYYNMSLAADISAGALDTAMLTAACSTCSQSLNVPMGFTVQTDQACTNNCCEWGCGQPFGVPCTGCSKSRCGETCVDKPAAVKVDMQDINICDAALSKASTIAPGVDNVAAIIKKANAMCPCLSKVPDYLQSFQVDDFKTAAVAGAGSLSACMIKRGLDIKSNSADLLSEGETDRVVRAPTIGLDLYLAFSAAAVGCAFGVTCEQLFTVWLKYFNEAAAAVGQGLADWLQDFLVQGVFEAVLGPLNQARAAVPSDLDAMKTTCPAGATAVSELQNSIAALDGIISDGTKTKDSVTAAVEKVKKSASMLNQPYQDVLLNLVQDALKTGQLNFLDNMNVIKTSEGVTTAINDAVAFRSSLPGVQQQVAAILAAVDNIGAAGCGGGDSQLAGLKQQFQPVNDVVPRVLNHFSGLTLDSLQAGVDTVNQHFEVSADLPCTTTGQMDFGPPPITQTIKYPQIYACRTAGIVPMPNELIPYIRIKGGRTSA